MCFSTGRSLALILLFLLCGFTVLAQKDSVLVFYKDTVFISRGKMIDWRKLERGQQNLTFTGTRIAQAPSDDYDSSGTILLSGYVSCYYATYSDTSNQNGYQKFPTSAPLDNTFSLNIVQLSARYQSSDFRGVFTFHYGDIPLSAWSAQFNMIQEANVGFKLQKKLWLDAGLFRTHIGLESIQPRENICYSVASTTYFEPYFLSGAKLTWQASNKLTLQANIFNGFNTFSENNSNKALGLSALMEFNKKLSLTVNSLVCDESPRFASRKQNRLYNNAYLAYRSRHIDLGAECNYGLQQNTRLRDSLGTASMFSALLSIRYKLNKKWAVYARGEYFYDPDEILTGPIENQNHQLIGINMAGLTAGIELKPIQNSYVRLEARRLHTTEDEQIFKQSGHSSNQRLELITGIGVWF